jgi:hypothetical protein
MRVAAKSAAVDRDRTTTKNTYINPPKISLPQQEKKKKRKMYTLSGDRHFGQFSLLVIRGNASYFFFGLLKSHCEKTQGYFTLEKCLTLTIELQKKGKKKMRRRRRKRKKKKL